MPTQWEQLEVAREVSSFVTEVVVRLRRDYGPHVPAVLRLMGKFTHALDQADAAIEHGDAASAHRILESLINEVMAEK